MITCSLEYITYPRKMTYSPDDYIIGRFRTKSENIPSQYRSGKNSTIFTAKGTGIPTEKKFDVLLEGKWNMSEKYGLELIVKKAEIATPTDEKGIRLYLEKFLNGCGPATSRKIYNRFGSNTLYILNNEPSKLLEIQGIRERQLKRMLKDFELHKQYQELSLLLADFNVGKKQIETIKAVLQENAIEKIKENPFVLQRFRGFGFDTLDAMSVRFGCNPAEPDRIKSAVKHILKLAMLGSKSTFNDLTLQTGGNLYVNQYVMRESAMLLLNQRADSLVTVSQVTDVICDMAKDYELRGENGNAYLCENYTHESKTAQYLVETLLYSNCKKYSDEKVDKAIRKAEAELSISLSASQIQGVKQALQHSVSIITGGAGTGKTTVLKVFLNCLKQFGEVLSDDNLCLAAPTGKAAIRMTEATGYAASTIHRALNLIGEDDYYKDETDIDYLEQSIIVCDEFSMADMFLAYRLMIAVPRHCARIVFLGDVGQLPSVGAGNVLNDMIESGVIPVTTLDVIFRQAQESNIVKNSLNIYRGIKNIEYEKDFLYTKEERPESIAEIVVETYLQQVKKYGKDEVIVLSPVKKSGTLSVPQLNNRIQAVINPPMIGVEEHTFHGVIFREKDKVMNLKNRECESTTGKLIMICNGDTGTIKRVRRTDDGYVCLIDFSYGRTVVFDKEMMNDVSLAYACTIHKSQGMEWQSVIMPLSFVFPASMLTRNLIYTGITRAKKMVNIIGDSTVLEKSIDNIIATRRNTALSYKIKKDYETERGFVND